MCSIRYYIIHNVHAKVVVCHVGSTDDIYFNSQKQVGKMERYAEAR